MFLLIEGRFDPTAENENQAGVIHFTSFNKAEVVNKFVELCHAEEFNFDTYPHYDATTGFEKIFILEVTSEIVTRI
jgi:hypothetical protein